MCFSATASFVASGVLLTSGVACLLLAQKKTFKLLGATPLIFALQQCSEGILWLTENSHPTLHTWATYTFLTFAFLVWPLWFPSILFKTGKSFFQKVCMRVALYSGILFSAVSLYLLIFIPITASVAHNHIAYSLSHPIPDRILPSILYLLATILPIIITPLKMIRPLGLGMLIAFFGTTSFFPFNVASVWCFYGAVIATFLIIPILYSRFSKT